MTHNSCSLKMKDPPIEPGSDVTVLKSGLLTSTLLNIANVKSKNLIAATPTILLLRRMVQAGLIQMSVCPGKGKQRGWGKRAFGRAKVRCFSLSTRACVERHRRYICRMCPRTLYWYHSHQDSMARNDALTSGQLRSSGGAPLGDLAVTFFSRPSGAIHCNYTSQDFAALLC